MKIGSKAIFDFKDFETKSFLSFTQSLGNCLTRVTGNECYGSSISYYSINMQPF